MSPPALSGEETEVLCPTGKTLSYGAKRTSFGRALMHEMTPAEKVYQLSIYSHGTEKREKKKNQEAGHSP